MKQKNNHLINLIHIMAINRSGGSLLARLFDGNDKVASYPMEIGFKFRDNLLGYIDKLTGTPTHIPEFNKEVDILDYFDAKEKLLPMHKWGKERSESLGVRKNYLEKAFYEKKVSTNFDFENYQKKLIEYSKNINDNYELYEAKHRAYFESWEYTKLKNFEHVVSHDSGGLFFHDFDQFFKFFPKSFVIIPIRNLIGYVAAEKTRIARKGIGTRRFSSPLPPNWMIKKFKNYSLNALVRSWMISFTKIRLLQEKFGIDKNLMVYRFENLANDTESHIKYICEKNHIKFDNNFLRPTLMGKPWLGNSQQGINNGINKNPNMYASEVLTKEEIKEIEHLSNNIDQKLDNKKELLTNLLDMKKDIFFDYDLQKKYSNNTDQWSTYCALGFRGFRDSTVKSPYFFQIVYYLFSIYVRICHFPRLIRLKLFPDKGKQNYT